MGNPKKKKSAKRNRTHQHGGGSKPLPPPPPSTAAALAVAATDTTTLLPPPAVLVSEDEDDDRIDKNAATVCTNGHDNESIENWEASTILQYKEQGNGLFGKAQYKEAREAYSRALILCEAASDMEHSELYWSLLSNRAMVHLKLEQFKAAEADCTQLLNNDHDGVPQAICAKVWYRRALARQGMVQESFATIDNCRQRLQQALEDANRAWSLLNELPEDRSSTRKSVAVLRQDLQQSLQRLEKPIASKIVPEGRQVWALLHARHESANPTEQVGTALPGEALLLLDWNWWCQWCAHVHFLQDNDQQPGPLRRPSSDRLRAFLRYMPPGAKCPAWQQEDNDDDDSEDGAPEATRRPGPIDNSCLFLVPPTRAAAKTATSHDFAQHWHARHAHYAPSSRPSSDDSSSLIRPNLVRGYHYELVPREVYYALVCWYGETTPSICRRVLLESRQVRLYPLIEPPKSASWCGACGAPRARLRCTKCRGGCYCDRTCQESHWPYHKVHCRNNAKGKMSKLGTVGLNNLGNTCFMNSACKCPVGFMKKLFVISLNARFSAMPQPFHAPHQGIPLQQIQVRSQY
jgi:tetratricopeptide (TPR) repeat protein